MHRILGLAATFVIAIVSYGQNYYGENPLQMRKGADNNVKENAFVQPQEAARAGNGIDQTLQAGDVLTGDDDDDLLIGGLGGDVLLGGRGDDVMIGGPEHFNPLGRDRAFGGRGDDVFLWAPGDGSDSFEGGQGEDTVIFGLIGQVENGQTVFRASNDQKTGEVWINPATGLPQADVTNQPGFCRIIDQSTAQNAGRELNNLGLDQLVQFFVRAAADTFERGEQTTDNGLRVTLHLKEVEYMVCTSRTGGVIEAFDLRLSPPAPINIRALPARIQALVK